MSKRLVISLFLIFSLKLAHSQCGAADFIVDDSIACSPQIVKFTAQNYPAGTTFEWNFGSGYLIGGEEYSTLFVNPGFYNVSLRLTYIDNSTCVITKNNFLRVVSPPKVNLLFSKKTLCHSLDSLFVTDNTPNSISRDWFFNNTLISNGPQIFKAQSNLPAGFKDLTIFLRDAFGCQSKTTLDSAVFFNQPITPDFAASKISGCTPARVNFTNLTDTLGKKIIQYNWSFPNGNPSSSTTFSPQNILYNTTDTFNVRLNVITSNGCSYTNLKPKYLFFADSINLNVGFNKTNLCSYEPLVISYTNSRSGNPNITFSPNSVTQGSTGSNFKSFKLNSLGSYSIRVEENYNGCISERNFNNYVISMGPKAGYVFNTNRTCFAPDSLLGNNTSILTPGLTATYRWDLYYDSVPNSSLQNSTSSTQFKAGLPIYSRYTVRLIAYGNNGCNDTLTTQTALTAEKMRARFSWIPKISCPGGDVTFTNNTLLGHSQYINRQRWTFYNLNNSVLKRDTILKPIVQFPSYGKFTAKLLVFNNLGCRDSITLSDTVRIERAKPRFQLSDSNICRNQTIRLKAIHQDTNFLSPYNHSWILRHKDSSNYVQYYYGDSTITFSGLWPGEYIIQYVMASKLNLCVDTFKLKAILKISGNRYSFNFTPTSGCNPFNVAMSARLLQTFNFINNNPTNNTIRWSSPFDTSNLVINNPTSLNTTSRIKKTGNFYFQFRYNTASGCNDSFNLGNIKSGIRANFTHPTYGCIFKKVKINEQSEAGVARRKWFIVDSTNGISFFPNDTAKNIHIQFDLKGIYRIGLAIQGNGNCRDTFYSNIIVNDIVANFTSSDTVNYCAPVISTVVGRISSDILGYSWYLSNGDSIKGLSTFSYLFRRNTGPAGVGVKLVVNGLGCNDTLDRPGYLKVIGPIPDFTISNHIGCEKLNVKFTNTSQYFSKFFLEFGNGFVDSVNFNNHIYRISDRSNLQEKYVPRLSLLDEFGCFAYKESEDTVIVSRSPLPDFSVDNDTGCAPLLVTFRNLSQGGATYKWFLDNDNIVDNTLFAPRFIYNAGDYTPKLVAFSTNGCSDTMTGNVFIKAYLRPDARIIKNKDSICFNELVNFDFNIVASEKPIKSQLWDFGDPYVFNDTSTLKLSSYSFRKLLTSQVELKVIDENNCDDTSFAFIYVWDTIGPVPPPINYVTVDGNNILVNWGQSKDRRFLDYNLYNDNSGYQLIKTNTNRIDTIHTITNGIDVNNNAYCFTLNSSDNCKYKGLFTRSHCSILLTISDSVNKLRLDWIAYNGWDKNTPGSGVQNYLIYRSENGTNGTFVLIDSTNGISYIDKKLCPKIYCYYVVAQMRNGPWKSRSNTACKTPKYLPPNLYVEPIRTTVLENNTTKTEWLPYKGTEYIEDYVISKRVQNFGLDDNYSSTDSLYFIDNDNSLLTGNESYTYLIRVKDHCENFSPNSSPNKTILLQGNSIDYVAKLRWTPYSLWHSGIKNYEIYMRQDRLTNTYQKIGQVDSSAREFSFDFIDTKMNDSLCFKIRAIKDTSILVESWSNRTCMVSDPQFWVPNAFSPNKDGKNEVFIPRTILIFNNTGNPVLDFKMEIFNRWGDKVFESTDASVGWDGTYKGEPCMEGHYLFKVKALGLDGTTNFIENGVVTLLR